MNALEAASLVMIPSGYENGTLGSLKPTDGSGDFTFSRGSDISATRVNEQGLIEKGYENLLKYSNAFSTSPWISTSLTLTSGQSGYDGSSDAWLITKTASNGRVQQSGFGTLSGVYTISLYAKKNASQWMRILGNASTNGDVFIDLENGVFGNASNVFDTNIESVGNGWYRCSFSANYSGIFEIRIYPADGDFDTSGTSGSIYIQDAMLNQGMVSYPYVETTTSPVAGGILEDMPRLDYTDSSCPALLLEPQRTNLLPYSEYFDGWSQTGTTLTTNTTETLSPEGLYNASKLVGNGTSGVIKSGIAKTGSVAVSVYLKSVSGSVNVTFKDPYGGLSNQVKSVTTEWQRFDFIGDNGASFAGFWVDDIPTSGIYMWGAQLEQDATYPTSYIPTYGTSQTRLAENATNSVANTTSRTYFLDGKRLADEGVGNTSPVYYPNDNLKITFWTNNRFRFRFGGAINSYYTLVGDDFKIAISYNGTDSKIFVNGVYWMTQSSFNLGNISALSISGNEGISYNQLLLFPTALSDDECIELTTI